MQKQEQPPNSRIDYRWRVDLEEGFDKASLLYDSKGRLRAIDYQTVSKATPPPKPRSQPR